MGRSRGGERGRGSVPLGVSSQTHLKELYFSTRGEREAEELSGAASFKKIKKEGIEGEGEREREQGPGEPG